MISRAPYRLVLVSALFLVAMLATYRSALDAGFVWDDNHHVPSVEMQSLAGLRRMWIEPRSTWQYYPLSHSAFWLQYHLWGYEPRGYHAVNVVLHTASALLVWRILAALAVPGALLAATIFAFHPVHVESVAWVSELKNTLSGFLYLSALLLYLRFDRPEGRRWSLYAVSLVLFVGALLSKSVTASLPAAILLIVWWKHGRLGWRRDVLPLVPHFVLGLAFGLVTIWVEVHHMGAEGAAFELTWPQRGLIAGRAVWFYFGKLVWPAPLSFIYPSWQIDAADARQYLAPIALLGLLAALWMLRRRAGRGPVAALLFFVGTLTPALGFFDVYPFRYSFVADHFQYLASLGVIALAAAGVGRALAQLGPRGRLAGQTACGLVLLVLALLSRQQCHAYRDLETLWRSTLASNPACWMCHNNLGAVLRLRGQTAEAVEHFRASLALKPGQAEPYYNIATALYSQGDRAGAIESFRQAVALEPGDFDSQGALANVLAEQGSWAEAAEHYARAVELWPNHLGARARFADALVKLGRLESAIEQLREVVRLAPDNPEARQKLDGLLALRERSAPHP